MFGRNILDKATLIHRLESMQHRQVKHGDTFSFEVYLGLTFASTMLVDQLALLVQAKDHVAFASKINVHRERFRDAPQQIRKSIAHYLGKRRGKLESFDDLPEILNRLKK